MSTKIWTYEFSCQFKYEKLTHEILYTHSSHLFTKNDITHVLQNEENLNYSSWFTCRNLSTVFIFEDSYM